MNTARFAVSLAFVLSATGLGCAVDPDEAELTASSEAALKKGDYGFELLTDAVTPDAVSSPAAALPAQVQGRLPPELVRDVLRTRTGAYAACGRAAAERGAAPDGEIVVRLVIAADGTVAGAHTKPSPIGDAAMAACLRDAIAALQFPGSQAGTIEILYPLHFGVVN